MSDISRLMGKFKHVASHSGFPLEYGRTWQDIYEMVSLSGCDLVNSHNALIIPELKNLVIYEFLSHLAEAYLTQQH